VSLAPHMRPAARSAAVRPHSSFPSPVREDLASPRPASAAGSCFAFIFLSPSPWPIGRQSYWQAGLCSHVYWEHGRGWEHVWERESIAFSVIYATVPTVPSLARACVMRARRCVCSPLSLFLGTWKQSRIAVEFQRLRLFPSLFPALLAVGTWEHREEPAAVLGVPIARSNKVEAGYGRLQRPDGGARRKFRASIARIQLQLTRRGENGGNLPFRARSIGHVGRPMLEGSAQAAGNASFPALRRKLGRLSAFALVDKAEQLLELALAGAIAADRRSRAPRAPNRAPSSAAMLALHGAGIWIESRSAAGELAQAGSIHDRLPCPLGQNAQLGTRQRGLGGARFSIARKVAGRWRNREAGRRAWVISRPAIARPHEAGGNRRLVRRNRTVKGAYSYVR
jgi:hypothetical protein